MRYSFGQIKFWFCILIMVAVITSGALLVFLLHGFADFKVSALTPIPIPPSAKRIPTHRTLHNDTTIDHYAWMRNIEQDPDVGKYIEEENDYTDKVMAPTEPVQKQLSLQLRRLQDSLEETPQSYLRNSWEQGDYLYYTRYKPGEDWPSYYRRPLAQNSTPKKDDRHHPSGGASSERILSHSTAYASNAVHAVQEEESDEELLLNVNELAAGKAYFAIGVFEVSPSQSLFAFSYDTTGDEKFTVIFKDIKAEKFLDDILNGSYYSLRWTADSKAVFYNRVDSLGIPRYVLLYVLHRSASQQEQNPKLIYEETDETLTAEVDSTNDGLFILIKIVGQIASEVRLLEASSNYSNAKPIIVMERKEGIQYSIDHSGDQFFIRTNAFDSPNFCVMRSPLSHLTDPRTWTEVVAHNRDRFLSRIECFAHHLVIWFWENGLQNFIVYNLATNENEAPLKFDSEVYAIFPGTISDQEDRLFRSFNSTVMTFSNSSYVVPRAIYSIDMETFAVTLVYAEKYSMYFQEKYCEQRIWVPSDYERNVNIPVSVVFSRLGENGCHNITKPRPLYLRGYGAYGGMMETTFDTARLPLLDMGFIVGYAHTRGDGILGADWYQEGKYEHKNNTLSDFFSCLRYFVKHGYTNKELIAVTGRSAGGLVAGGVLVFAPTLAKAVIAQVPFVDVITDQMDPTIPWAAYEWYEWGNPVKSAAIYQAMKKYSPYDNVKAKDYPHALLIGGRNDARVGFYEPLKMTASLRFAKTDNNLLLARIYDKGHFAAAGSDEIAETSFIYAFMLKALDLDFLVSHASARLAPLTWMWTLCWSILAVQ